MVSLVPVAHFAVQLSSENRQNEDKVVAEMLHLVLSWKGRLPAEVFGGLAAVVWSTEIVSLVCAWLVEVTLEQGPRTT